MDLPPWAMKEIDKIRRNFFGGEEEWPTMDIA
jgi:hypothetical protein